MGILWICCGYHMVRGGKKYARHGVSGGTAILAVRESNQQITRYFFRLAGCSGAGAASGAGAGAGGMQLPCILGQLL